MTSSEFQQLLNEIPHTPVYQDEYTVLYHADCMSILPHIQPAKDRIVVSDPPYGIKWVAPEIKKRILGDDKPFNPAHLLKYRCILFGAQHYCTRLTEGGSWIIWDKRCSHNSIRKGCKVGPVRMNDLGDYEDIWTSFHAHHTLYRHQWNGFCKATERGVKRIHPTQKPVALMSWLINDFTKTGDLVIDPYSGSASTLVAARQHHRYCIGIELDEQYIQPSIDRIKTEAMQ